MKTKLEISKWYQSIKVSTVAKTNRMWAPGLYFVTSLKPWSFFISSSRWCDLLRSAEDLRVSSLHIWFQSWRKKLWDEGKKPSRLVNPSLTKNHQKSIFNSAVCVRFPLNPQLYNPFRQLSLSCANKHVTDPKRGGEARARPQSFPDGTRRWHYLHRLGLVPEVTPVERLPRWPRSHFFPTRALISAEEDLPPEMRRCGVTLTHLLQMINLPAPTFPHMGFFMIFHPWAGRALHTDQRATFPLA